jgi:hypothetical protein
MPSGEVSLDDDPAFDLNRMSLNHQLNFAHYQGREQEDNP